MLDALDRLSEFRVLRVEDLDLAHVPPGRLHTLTRYAALSKAQAFNGCGTSVKLQLSWHLPGSMNRLLKTML